MSMLLLRVHRAQQVAAGGGGGDLTPVVLTSSAALSWSSSQLTTASVSFGANDLALAWVASRFTEATSEDDIACAGGGMTTWDRIIGIPYASDSRILSIFRSQQAVPGAAAAVVFSETNTGDGTGTTTSGIIKIPGALVGNNGSDAVQGLDFGAETASPNALTIAASPAAGDICIGIIAVLDNTNNLTSDANYVTLITVGPSDETLSRFDWDSGQDLNATWTYGPTNPQSGAAAFLVKKAT